MTRTSDPRTVTSGRVRVSPTSNVKRDALLGRWASHQLVDGTDVIGVIEEVDGLYPKLRIFGGQHDGCWVRLDSVVALVEPPAARR